MIKLLVVEDETATRKNLIKHIKWSELGVDVVEEARDGIDGLETARRIHPDIIVSDIRMPGMNGIEFTSNIRKQYPECRIIYLSGYSDKEYLKTAIRINAVSYVEKPINIEEFQEAVKKAVHLCQEHKRIKETEININLTLSDSLPFIKHSIVSGLIHNKIDESELERNLNLADISFDPIKSYTVSIIVPTFEETTTKRGKQSYCDDIIEFLNHPTNDFFHLAVVNNTYNIIVLSAHRPGSRKEFVKLYQQLLEHLEDKENLRSSLSWIVGSTTSELLEVNHSYQLAASFIENLFFYDSGDLYFAHDKIGSVYNKYEQEIQSYTKLLKDLQEDNIMQFIENLYHDIKTKTGTPLDKIKSLFLQMMRMLVEEGKKRGLAPTVLTQQTEEFDWVMLSKIDTLKELKDQFQKNAKSILESIDNIESNSRAVLDVIKYIHDNYSKEITVNLLANHVQLTPTYLSTLFRKETGKTISEYLTEFRIEKSVGMLMEPHAKLYEIAYRSGYYDANYFTKAFKKVKGMTPSQFRRKYRS